MVKINYCPSCGHKLLENSFICPNCNFNVEMMASQEPSLMDESNIEIIGDDYLQNQNVDVNPGDEIVIVVPEADGDDEIVIDLDKLGIDLESLGDEINVVIQVEGDEFDDLLFDEEDEDIEPNEWYFDDDPYEIVYYEFPDLD